MSVKGVLMKKIIVAVAVVTAMVSLAYASVNGIRSNGGISGVPSYQVSCSSGNTVIIYKKMVHGIKEAQDIWGTNMILGQRKM